MSSLSHGDAFQLKPLNQSFKKGDVSPNLQHSMLVLVPDAKQLIERSCLIRLRIPE